MYLTQASPQTHSPGPRLTSRPCLGQPHNPPKCRQGKHWPKNPSLVSGVWKDVLFQKGQQEKQSPGSITPRAATTQRRLPGKRSTVILSQGALCKARTMSFPGERRAYKGAFEDWPRGLLQPSHQNAPQHGCWLEVCEYFLVLFPLARTT